MSREVHTDHATSRRMMIAAVALAAAMLGMFGAIGWVILDRNGAAGEASSAQSLTVSLLIVVVLCTVVSVFRAYGRLRWFYRCPTCHKRLPRAAGADSRIRYHCAACGVDWDTGWHETDGD